MLKHYGGYKMKNIIKLLLLITFVTMFGFNSYCDDAIISDTPQEFDSDVKVYLPQRPGPIVSEYPNNSYEKYVINDTKVRTSPYVTDDDSNLFKIFNVGTKITVVDETEQWYKIHYEDNYVYIQKEFIGDEEDLNHIFSSVFDNITETEMDEFLKMLYLECGNEPFEGKIACVEETCRRVVSTQWPNTVHDVIFQKGQFSTARSIKNVVEGQPYRPYGDSCVDFSELRKAVEYVKVNGYTILPKYAVQYGFRITEHKDYVFWATYKANGKNFIKIGRHYFGMGNV